MDAMPRVSIIILNWNGWKDTVECLESIYQITYPNYDVIVVDNGSDDDSIQKIKKYASGEIIPDPSFYPYCKENKPIACVEYTYSELGNNSPEELMRPNTIGNKSLILIKNEKNSGFSGGNNIAIRYALKNLNPDYYLLLNNDTVVHPEFLGKLVQGVTQNEMTVITGPKCYYYDHNRRTDVIWFAGGELDFWRYPCYRHVGIGEIDCPEEYNGIKDCDWITGAAIMISKAAPIRYLDDHFFFGCEDVDLCIKIKSQGYRIAVNLNAKIWHKVGNSRQKAYSHRIKSFCRSYKENMKLLINNNPQYLLRIPILTLMLVLATILSLIKRYHRSAKFA